MSEPEMGPCEECETVTELCQVEIGPEEWWLCSDCRRDHHPPPGKPDR